LINSTPDIIIEKTSDLIPKVYKVAVFGPE